MPFVIAQTDKGQSNRFLIQRETRRVSPAGLFVATAQKEPPRFKRGGHWINFVFVDSRVCGDSPCSMTTSAESRAGFSEDFADYQPQ
jgi:hypothetical protein